MDKLRGKLLHIDRQLIQSQGSIKDISKVKEYQQLTTNLFKIYDQKQEEIMQQARKNTVEPNVIDQLIAKDLKTFKENLKLACSFIIEDIYENYVQYSQILSLREASTLGSPESQVNYYSHLESSLGDKSTQVKSERNPKPKHKFLTSNDSNKEDCKEGNAFQQKNLIQQFNSVTEPLSVMDFTPRQIEMKENKYSSKENLQGNPKFMSLINLTKSREALSKQEVQKSVSPGKQMYNKYKTYINERRKQFNKCKGRQKTEFYNNLAYSEFLPPHNGPSFSKGRRFIEQEKLNERSPGPQFYNVKSKSVSKTRAQSYQTQE